MKKHFLLLVAILFAASTFAQTLSDTNVTIGFKPTTTQKVMSKADSFMVVYANKQHIDTNASAEQMAEQADKVINLIPKKGSGPLKWLAFLAALLMLVDYLYFWIKHRVAQIKALFKGTAVLLILLSFSNIGHAQVISSQRLQKYYNKHPEKAFLLGSEAPATTPAATSGYILSLEPSFGLNALTIQKGPNGWESSGTVAPSFTYGLSVGEYTANPTNMTVKNYVTIGAGVAGGIIPSANITGSFQAYGFVTIYNYATLGAGYDAVTKKPFFGIGASVPLFTFQQGLGSYILKLF